MLYFCCIGILIGIEFAYRKPLFDKSIELRERLEPNITSGGKGVFQALSIWGDGIPYFVIYIFVFNWEDRPRSFYYVLFLTTCLWIMNLTKLAYHEPRPYMYSEKIQPIGCSPEYGNPSGHSIFAAAFNFFIFFDFFHAKENQPKRHFRLYYSIWLFIAVVLTLLIGFARFYVGVHTLNQVIYGFSWGLWLAFYFHFALRQFLMEHVTSIAMTTQNSSEQVDQH